MATLTYKEPSAATLVFGVLNSPGTFVFSLVTIVLLFFSGHEPVANSQSVDARK